MQSIELLGSVVASGSTRKLLGLRHVVLLDDDVRILQSLERLLSSAGFRVTATTNAKEAMEVVVCEGADAIVSDLHMPDMGGHVVLAMLTQAAPKTARVLMTSETDFTRVAPLVVPYSVHAFIAKSEVARRLLPALTELFNHRPETDDAAEAEEARKLAKSIVRALALRDYETELHCERVAAWSRKLASCVGLDGTRLLDVELGALLHDSGKIGVRDGVLLKPGPLNEKEWEEMRKHPDLGVSLLADIPALKRAIPVVHCHHERRDGKGYPQKLGENDIPIDARIFQVADAYDAIVSDRPYRKGRSDSDARKEILQHVGPQFDPVIYDAFMSIEVPDWLAVIADL